MKRFVSLPLASAMALRVVTAVPMHADDSTTIHYLGRINPATKELTWPGTGVSFSFEGTSATIGLESFKGSNGVALIVDGGKPIVITNVTGSLGTPNGLSQGSHTVALHKRTETAYGTMVLGDITVKGALGASSSPTRQVEIIGDSITVGYGLDGTGPCTATATNEGNPLTYGAAAAGILGADYNVVAWSGKGVTRNSASNHTDTSPLMPELWTRYGGNDADNSYTFPSTWNPDAVVVNLGSNDFSYVLADASGQPYAARPQLNPTTYTNAMVQFVRTIQSRYQKAQIFILTSPVLSDQRPYAADKQKTTQANALNAAVSQIGEKAHLVDWPTQGSSTGCATHPNAATNAAEARVLASAIASKLGW